ncbi:ThiF family adenylyltransferase [Nocardia sp. NPDC057353]|uniref:ThiF family adenylyltransferase n=1 Tax=Nocardia sp. NPDC057353 TaxID=3346104 RepID=UPI00362694DC
MTNLEVAFFDRVLREINDFIAAHPPERGGALLGPIGQPVVSRFIPDHHGDVTGVTYTPSAALQQVVAETTNFSGNLEYKGIVHSHPVGIAQPSSGDYRAFANHLRRAPWLGRMICPIVTSGQRLNGRHRMPLTNGTFSVYVAEARINGVEVVAAEPRVIPLERDLAVMSERLGLRAEPGDTFADVDGVLFAVGSFRAADADIVALFPPTYPTLPPLILVTPVRGATGGLAELAAAHGSNEREPTVSLPLEWNVNRNEWDRLAAALDAVRFPAERPDRPPFSFHGASSGSDAAAEGGAALEGLRARLDGVVASAISDAHVLIVGLGSGGSQTAEQLARASVGRFTLIDPDTVSAANLSRSVYRWSDVGQAKTDALAVRLREINPAVSVTTRTAALDEVPEVELLAAIEAADLVIAATDDPKAQTALNHRAWTLGRPAVFGGVYAKGRAGQVVFTVPGVTACFRCATGNRQSGTKAAGALDYGTGQLVSEPALGVDIGHVVTASVKVAIGLLELGCAGEEHSAGALVLSALEKGQQYVILSATHDFDYFPQLFAETAGQHAYQSVWLSPSCDPACPTCGTQPLAADANITGAPDLARLTPVETVELFNDPNPEEPASAAPAPEADAVVAEADAVVAESDVAVERESIV